MNSPVTRRIEPDRRKRTPIIAKPFEWYAAGDISLKAVTMKAAAAALTNRVEVANTRVPYVPRCRCFERIGGELSHACELFPLDPACYEGGGGNRRIFNHSVPRKARTRRVATASPRRLVCSSRIAASPAS